MQERATPLSENVQADHPGRFPHIANLPPEITITITTCLKNDDDSTLTNNRSSSSKDKTIRLVSFSARQANQEEGCEGKIL